MSGVKFFNNTSTAVDLFIIYYEYDKVIKLFVVSGEKTYSGLYEYHIPTNTWKKRRGDVGSGSLPDRELRSRSSHSMLFHQVQVDLYPAVCSGFFLSAISFFLPFFSFLFSLS
jgi:hypothetical protein